MLSISAPIKGRGGADYYLTLACEDYYTQGGEPPGTWIGHGARLLHLKGQVEAEVMRSVLDGFSPDGRVALVQNAASEDRQCGWDLTFSAPKSVSVLWSQASPEVRRAIQDAQAAAVEEAIDYLQDEAGITRRGRGGGRVESASFVAAAFEHATSREHDPQLHTHVVLMNLGVRSDGSTGAILSEALFDHKMAAGAIYRAELAALLGENLGLAIDREGEFFAIRGVSETLCHEFSKRREQIEEALVDRGLSGPVAASFAALDTRADKEIQPRGLLFEAWQETGRDFGWSTDQAESLLRQKDNDQDLAAARREALREAMDSVGERQSTFTKREFVQALAEAATGFGLDAEDVRWMARTRLAEDDIVTLENNRRAGSVYTTKDIIALEQSTNDRIEQASTTIRFPVAEETLRQVLEVHSDLSERQRRALEHIVAEPGSIHTISEATRREQIEVLKAARMAWEMEGIFVQAVAQSERAAEAFEAKTGIKTRPTNELLAEGLGMELRLKEKSLFRTHTQLPHLEIKVPFLQFGPKESVLVVDKADELSPWQRHEAVLAEGWGVKLVLVTSTKKEESLAREREDLERRHRREEREREEERERARKEQEKREEEERRKREEERRRQQTPVQSTAL